MLRRFKRGHVEKFLLLSLWGRLSSLLSTPAERPKVKPDGLTYGTDDLPPFGVLAISVLQHTALVLMLSIYAVITAQEMGLNIQDTIQYTASCLFCVGLHSVLQGVRSRFTPGIMGIGKPSPIPLATLMIILTAWGPGAAIGAMLASNVIIVVLAPFLPRMRAYLPPEIVGVAVFMIGITIIPLGVERSLSLSEDGIPAASSLVASSLTLFGIFAASISGNERVRLCALFIGVGLGIFAITLFGTFDTENLILLNDMQFLAFPLPSPLFAAPVFIPIAIFSYLIVVIILSSDQIASAMTLDKLTDGKWVRADIRTISRSVATLALGNLFNGAMGVSSGTTSTANIGLGHASGILSRHIAISTGVFIMILAFLPAVALVIVITPLPVVGAVLIYTAAFMIVAGMELILSRMMNAKRGFTVGFSIVVGVTMLLLPSLSQNFPEWSQTIAGSALSAALLTAMVLNALLRIGVARTTTIDLGAPQDWARESAEMLEHWGAEWGARKEVVIRAGIAVGEALEMLEQSELIDGPPRLTARFDEINLHCTITYPGRPVQLKVEAIDIDELLEADETKFETSLNNVSAMLISRLADRVSVGQKAETARLFLEFNH